MLGAFFGPGFEQPGFGADAVDCLAADFFGAAVFFFFAVVAVARVFFFGSTSVVLPFVDGVAASSAVFVSTELFGFLGTVVGW